MRAVTFWGLILAGGCGLSAAVGGLLKGHDEPLVAGAALAVAAYGAVVMMAQR